MAFGVASLVAAALPAGGQSIPAPGETAAPPKPTAPLDAFASFTDLCLHNRLKPADALSQAATAGWMPVPRVFMPHMPNNFTTTGARWRSSRQSALILIAGSAEEPLVDRKLTMTFCGVSTSLKDKAFTKSAREWANVATPFMVQDGFELYVFNENGSAHGTLSSDPMEILRQFEAGTLSMIGIETEPDLVTVLYLTPALGQVAEGPVSGARNRIRFGLGARRGVGYQEGAPGLAREHLRHPT